MPVCGSVLGRVYLARFDLAPFSIFKPPVEARLVAGVAGRPVPHLLNHEQDGVLVTVDADLPDDLEVSGLLALAPQALAAAREIARASGCHGLLKCLAVHVRK